MALVSTSGDDPVDGEIDHGQLVDLLHLEAMQNLDQKMEHVVEVVPGLHLIRRAILFGGRLLEMPGNRA